MLQCRPDLPTGRRDRLLRGTIRHRIATLGHDQKVRKAARGSVARLYGPVCRGSAGGRRRATRRAPAGPRRRSGSGRGSGPPTGAASARPGGKRLDRAAPGARMKAACGTWPTHEIPAGVNRPARKEERHASCPHVLALRPARRADLSPPPLRAGPRSRRPLLGRPRRRDGRRPLRRRQFRRPPPAALPGPQARSRRRAGLPES